MRIRIFDSVPGSAIAFLRSPADSFHGIEHTPTRSPDGSAVIRGLLVSSARLAAKSQQFFPLRLGDVAKLPDALHLGIDPGP